MERVIEHRVTAEQDGRILRDLLRREFGISAKLLSRIKRMPDGICINGEHVFVNVQVREGDLLRVILEQAEQECMLLPQEGELDIRYEDPDILIVNKPAGLPVQPAIGKSADSLGNIVVWHYARKGERIVYRPVNRLDSGTSGLMAIAKNSHTHSALINQLHTGDFRREYLAVVHGVLESDGCVDAPICRKDGSVLMRQVHPQGKPARTNYSVIERFERHTLVRLRLESGRTHQIRVHMSHMGHPLVGDFLYGREESELIDRCALHSVSVDLKHPFTLRRIAVDAELPRDMQCLLDEKLQKLKNNS